MNPKKVSESRTEMSQLMMPNDSNYFGFVHGGSILSIVDKVAYVCACRHASSFCVTVSVDQVVFKEPIKVGELVVFKASVNYAGTTSMEIGIKIIAEDLLTGKRRHTNSCYFTMVAVDKSGKKHEVPKLILENEEDVRRHADAEKRRVHRLMQRTDK
ncbi:MAG: acyl-CoA thioesterase [Candidatus Omnitrophica bacterium]|nr:acyl-CoA thioesterase [Candidatus Omnitrophota bacterium]